MGEGNQTTEKSWWVCVHCVGSYGKNEVGRKCHDLWRKNPTRRRRTRTFLHTILDLTIQLSINPPIHFFWPQRPPFIHSSIFIHPSHIITDHYMYPSIHLPISHSADPSINSIQLSASMIRPQTFINLLEHRSTNIFIQLLNFIHLYIHINILLLYMYYILYYTYYYYNIY